MATKARINKEYSIREAARLSGLPESTLRYYESIGLIQQVDRDSSSGHRRYSEDDLNVITSIACLNATGMSLEDMREYIGNRSSGPQGAKKQVALLSDQKKRLYVEEQMLKIRQEYVDLKVKYWQAIERGDTKKAQTISKKAILLTKELTHKK